MSKITKEQIIKLQRKLKTDAAIGDVFGVSRQAIHQLRLKYGITALEERNKERNLEMIKLYKNGISGTKLSQKVDLSISQTYRILDSLKKKS